MSRAPDAGVEEEREAARPAGHPRHRHAGEQRPRARSASAADRGGGRRSGRSSSARRATRRSRSIMTDDSSLQQDRSRCAEERVRPARPHQRLTDDGRRMREVLTYSRRGSRFTPTQAAGLGGPPRPVGDPRRGAWTSPASPGRSWFGREAPLIVEIGSGIGESTAALAAARPDLRRPGARGVAPGRGRRPGPGRRGRGGQRAVLLGRRGLVDGAPGRARARWPGCGPSSPTRGTRSGTTSGGWSTPGSRALAASPAGARRDVAAGHRLGRLRRADASRCSTPSRR